MAINIRVLFFGATAAEVGNREVEISLKENTPSGLAFSEVIEKFPKLKSHKLLFALNQKYTGGDEVIRDGDELAVFTAVSGG